ncbi:DUF2752 domain-containing protein [Nocardioides marmoriginsengisoli]|uniref:DUF2752 domain-containing protein n=1 Tax=Nocardioides marmoriginsengisoli TaxID=661483 RepID=A0A3N0CGG0_9ACTN|nr:DUF2752 domain-containing protein [Nocardioides marmoriginsengisoli]RNL62311.1 DUF2752 domain-containing protein [Nocardioides marmoriginsengisoli]
MTPANDRAPAATVSQVVVSAAIGVAATTAVALVDPHRPGHYPGCPLLWATGLYCPFCGGLRAVHDLTHLDLGAALDRNPLVVLGLPFVLLGWALWAQRAFTGRRIGSFPRWLGWSVLAVLLGYAVLRNLPGWTFLSPA